MGFGRARLVGLVEDSLGGLEAEFDEEPGGVEAVAGLGVGEIAVHGGDEEADDEPAVVVSWAMMSAMLYICSDYRMVGRRCQGRWRLMRTRFGDGSKFAWINGMKGIFWI